MTHETITKNGQRFVLVPIREYRKMSKSAGALPMPPIDKDGNADALAFARASIARRLRADREAAGLSQQALADMAGVRQETVSRIESGKNMATVPVMDKLTAAMKKHAKRR